MFAAADTVHYRVQKIRNRGRVWCGTEHQRCKQTTWVRIADGGRLRVA
jgi:hypothetical protein